MAEDGDYRNQFDRFAQDEYLQILLRSDKDAIIPMLFLDLMNQVNLIQGQAGLVLAEVEHAESSREAMDPELTQKVAVRILDSAVDMSNVLKALMEYYELTHRDDDEHKA